MPVRGNFHYINSRNTERIYIKNDLSQNYSKKSLKKKIIILISSVIGSLIIISILIILKPWKKKKDNPEDEYIDYKKKFIFKTRVGDLKRINLSQKSYEKMIIEGVEAKVNIYRKNIYDIYIISEEEAEDKNKQYYNKTYTGAISIVGKCFNLENEDCNPKELVDLGKKENVKKFSGLRNLEKLENLKDIPIPVCLFNLTDNNIIISIKCPQSLSENMKNEIISDIYYFRPTFIKSFEKIEDINFTIEKGDNVNIINKNRTGLCNIKNELNSICNSEMSITVDNEGNLIAHNEMSLINITTNSKNGFSNNRITHFIDQTKKIDINPKNYKLVLKNLLNELKPYMKYEKIASKEIFNHIYNISDEKENEKYKNEKRNLERNNYYENEESLFFKEIFGINISLNLKDISGINSEAMKIYTNLKFNSENHELVNIAEFTDINKAINKLILLSKA